MKTITLKNYFLVSNPQNNTESLQDWLSKQMLHGQASRARTRFIKLLQERISEIDEERMRLLEEHAKKEEAGEIEKPVYLDEDGEETTDAEEGVKFKLKDSKKFQEDYLDYLQEDFVIDVTPSVKDTVYGVRDLLMETNEEFSGRQATLYDEICTAFEEIS